MHHTCSKNWRSEIIPAWQISRTGRHLATEYIMFCKLVSCSTPLGWGGPSWLERTSVTNWRPLSKQGFEPGMQSPAFKPLHHWLKTKNSSCFVNGCARKPQCYCSHHSCGASCITFQLQILYQQSPSCSANTEPEDKGILDVVFIPF